MPCIQHQFKTVSNHYDSNGVINTDSFSGGEWRVERICTKCGKVFEDSEYLKELINK